MKLQQLSLTLTVKDYEEQMENLLFHEYIRGLNEVQ